MGAKQSSPAEEALLGGEGNVVREEIIIEREPEEESCCKSCYKALEKCEWWLFQKILIALGVIFCLTWLVQGVMYAYATLGCGPRALDGYNFPGSEASDTNTAWQNLQPRVSLITERDPTWTSKAWDSIPSNEAAQLAEAPNGVWWSTWGPIFNTYTFEDVANSKMTVYMRRNLLRLGMSHRIGRCDGHGPLVTFSEGSNYFTNRIRRLFGFNQGMTFKIYLDDDLVAVAEETSKGVESLTFRDEKTSESVASAVLQQRHFHGKFDQWLVKSQKSSPLPYFVPDAVTVLFANHVQNHDDTDKTPLYGTPTPAPQPLFLEALPANMSAPVMLEANMTAEQREKVQAVKNALELHAQVMPPNWIHENDVSAPMLALAAVFLVPILGVPIMVCCKNGNFKKVWSA